MNEDEMPDLATDDAALVKAALQAVSRPTVVNDIRVELADDSTGDPAVWIYLIVDENDHPDAATINAIAAFSRKIKLELLGSAITRFPYIQVSTESR